MCRCRRAESTGSNSADWVQQGRELAGPGFARGEVDGPVAGGWGSPTRSYLEPNKEKGTVDVGSSRIGLLPGAAGQL